MFDPVPFVSVDRARIDEMTALLWLGRRRLSALETLCSNLHRSSYCTAAALLAGNGEHSQPQKENRKWLALPPFTPQLDASAVGKEIYGRASELRGEGGDPTTALKWVRRCCPHLPMSLVQKLFRLRQVRREIENQDEQQRVKRVSAKDAMASGDVILLPLSVQKVSAEKTKSCSNSEDETDFIRSLVLYQDPAIIVINKPPGMPVQGGVGITHSVDVIGATCLKYESSEPPRLVHRLDRDSSGILVLARTQTSASVLHSIFREKTSGILINGVENTHRALQRKYWALVIGTPRRPKGLISAPLVKIVLEDGKSERVTIVKDMETTSSQHAVTEYKVIRSSTHGYTWLELQPLTGRKHQLRVHCAEVLGTPIVGDYKYGWKAHRHLKPMPCSKPSTEQRELPFGLESEGGSISEKQPRLHLHCRQMILPDISSALQHMQSSTKDHDLSKLEMLDLVAPLPSHMQMSWDILSY